MSSTECEKTGTAEGGDIQEYESPSEEVFDNRFNLSFSIAIVDTEASEIDDEFIDAVTEIEGKKCFPCDKCDNVCKSKDGLTRHTNSKHGRQENLGECLEESFNIEAFDEETVHSFVEVIKARIIEEDLYSSDTNKALATVTSTKALYEAVLPILKTFVRKKNQDKLLESFYGVHANMRAVKMQRL